MEMDSEIWSTLPQELLLLVLANLPTLIMIRFRAVCKRWKYLLSPVEAFQRLLSTVSPCSFPALLIIRRRRSWATRSRFDKLYLIHSLSTRVRLDFFPHTSLVRASCKSLLCYSAYVNGEPTSFYICNPITRTWKTLPPTTPLREPPHFIGLAFDNSTRICILVIGLIDKINGERNKVDMEIYDSETDTWTKFEMNIPVSISPKGEGIYSTGKFYWVSDPCAGQDWAHIMYRFDVAAFDVAEKRWDVIALPERPILEDTQDHSHWKLTGYDGKVVLVDHKDLSLWKLNEEVNAQYKWSELQVFPRSLYEDSEKDLPAEVIVHSCGWVFLHLFGNKMVVFDAQGRLLHSIDGCLVRIFKQSASPLSLRAFELNNVWWP